MMEIENDISTTTTTTGTDMETEVVAGDGMEEDPIPGEGRAKAMAEVKYGYEEAVVHKNQDVNRDYLVGKGNERVW